MVDADAVLVHPAEIPIRLGRLHSICGSLVALRSFLLVGGGAEALEVVVAHFDHGVYVLLLGGAGPVDQRKGGVAGQ